MSSLIAEVSSGARAVWPQPRVPTCTPKLAIMFMTSTARLSENEEAALGGLHIWDFHHSYPANPADFIRITCLE